nr:hypothetical protein [uncultured Novosphingobium sp.]
MAIRPIFIPVADGPVFVRTEMVPFTWHPGLSVSQKQKSVASLHEAARETLGLPAILEVSSKSTEQLGVALSAFNLPIYHPLVGRQVSVECAFQAGKVFQDGGPFLDLLHMTPRDAKRDPRLRESGQLTTFRFDGEEWPIEPQTAFYDWLYITALLDKPELAKPILAHQAFTDIEFNPQQSINCQAYSVAMCVSLARRGILMEVASTRETFLDSLKGAGISNARQNDVQQGFLF